MVTGFRRSLSLPGSPGLKTRSAPEKSYHVRSTSLPCRSHPLISQLEDEIRSIRAWKCQPEPESGSPAWICAGLARLELLHASLDDLLHLPQTQDSLRRGSGWTDRVMDDFLRFADAHGTFRSAIVALKQHQSAAQIAIRRRDAVKLASCVRSQKKTEKELVKLASSLKDVSKSPIASRFASEIGEAELAGIIREVITATVTASAAVFLGIAAVSSVTSSAVAASTLLPSKTSWMVGPLMRSFKKRSAEVEEEGGEYGRSAIESLEGLEECIGALESKSERVFRCLINTRVSLLNILTP